MESTTFTPQPSLKYVAFCDVLGFSNAVLERFDETAAIYTEFIGAMRNCPFHEKAKISVYSDSILVIADELYPLLHAVQSLFFVTLMHSMLIRGGVAHGRHWEQSENGNLFVLSEPLVRAVKLESSVSVPAIVLSEEITLGDEIWIARFSHGPFLAPVLHFNGLSLVNPFNEYWFKSARMRVAQLWERFPEHGLKYSWFLALSDAIENGEPLIPESVLERFVAHGVLKLRSIEPSVSK